jgi:hypothetical protein
MSKKRVWVAHYWRYHSEYEDAFDSLEDALGFLLEGEDRGTLSSDRITGPDGFALSDTELTTAIWNTL